MVHSTSVLPRQSRLHHGKLQACPGGKAEALPGCLGNQRTACERLVLNDSSPWSLTPGSRFRPGASMLRPCSHCWSFGIKACWVSLGLSRAETPAAL